jgi:glutaconyl-CoA decarboxylase
MCQALQIIFEVIFYMEHSPVTTNPLIIMMINMTVVFIVLVSLMFLIKLIHMVDPTKEPEKPAQSDEEEPLVAVKSEPVPAPLPVPVVEEGISPEVIAAISAAITAYGFSGQVKAVRIVNHEGTPWRNSMRNAQCAMRNGRR